MTLMKGKGGGKGGGGVMGWQGGRVKYTYSVYMYVLVNYYFFKVIIFCDHIVHTFLVHSYLQI